MEGSDFVSATTWRDWLNEGVGLLHDVLVSHFDDDYYEAEQAIVTGDGAATRFALPSDFLKGLGVDVETSSRWLPARRLMRGERGSASLPYRYRFAARKVWIEPAPAEGQRFRLSYVPKATPLVNDADEVDYPNGWEDLIILHAARKALAKEESDTTVVERELAGTLARIDLAAANRDAAEPARVVDVYSNDDEDSLPRSDVLLDLE